MDLLIKKLAELSDIKVRTKIGILRELYEEIKEAQNEGYDLVTIHDEICKIIPTLKLRTFITTLTRISKEITKGDIVDNIPISKVEVIAKDKRNSKISKTSTEKENRQTNAQIMFNRNK